MRRIKRVHIYLSENFYNFINDGRKKTETMLHKKNLINKSLSTMDYADLLLKHKMKLPVINFKNINHVKKKGRR